MAVALAAEAVVSEPMAVALLAELAAPAPIAIPSIPAADTVDWVAAVVPPPMETEPVAVGEESDDVVLTPVTLLVRAAPAAYCAMAECGMVVMPRLISRAASAVLPLPNLPMPLFRPLNRALDARRRIVERCRRCARLRFVPAVRKLLYHNLKSTLLITYKL